VLSLPLIGIALTKPEISNSCPHGYKYQPRAFAPNTSATASHSLTFSLPFKNLVAVFLLSRSKPTPMVGEDNYGKRAAEEVPEEEMLVGQHIRCMR
jgi:hypothetical protein